MGPDRPQEGAVEMGYFSNGTEGFAYQETYCYRCAHWKDVGDGRGEGCPVMDLHLLYNGDQLDDKGEPKEPLSVVLSMLIPEIDDGAVNDQCAMFVEAK